MKYLFLFMAGALIASCNVTDKKTTSDVSEEKSEHTTVVSSSKDSTDATTIEWLDPVIQDLGSITKGQVVEISWKFKNTGTKPLTIEDVRAQCGCTVPDPPKEPIAPGGEGVIKAKFNSDGSTGHVSKEVYVVANNNNRNNGADNKLTFTADVKE
jgi:hypothetical protein